MARSFLGRPYGAWCGWQIHKGKATLGMSLGGDLLAATRKSASSEVSPTQVGHGKHCAAWQGLGQLQHSFSSTHRLDAVGGSGKQGHIFIQIFETNTYAPSTASWFFIQAASRQESAGATTERLAEA